MGIWHGIGLDTERKQSGPKAIPFHFHQMLRVAFFVILTSLKTILHGW